MKRIAPRSAVLLALCLVVVAPPMCSGQPPSADWSLVTGEPCEPPCWQGLVPGQSTGADVEDFLETSHLVDHVVERSEHGYVYWQSVVGGARRNPVSAYRTNSFRVGEDGLLEHIRIYLDYDFTLEQLLRRYGTPDRMGAGPAGTPERPWIGVGLFYPERGMMLTLELPVNDKVLRPETKVVWVYYTTPTTVQDLPTALVGENPEETLHLWPGYGPVQ
jgi:hypothetical protein